MAVTGVTGVWLDGMKAPALPGGGGPWATTEPPGVRTLRCCWCCKFCVLTRFLGFTMSIGRSYGEE